LKWYLLFGTILFEVGLRLVLGNSAQSRLLMHSEHADVCLENQRNVELTYTGWLKRVPATTMRTNAHGARGDAFAQTKAPDTLRIAHLGDSFTFGQGVEEDEAFASVLAGELESDGLIIETLNFGVPGHGTPQSIALLERRVLALSPDVVVLHVFANDLSAEDSYCLQGQSRGERPIKRWLLRNIYLVRLGMVLSSPFRQVATPENVAALGSPEDRYRAAIRKGSELASEHGFLFAVVLLTDDSMFTDSPYCQECTAPHALMAELPALAMDMSATWTGLQKDSAVNFIPGEGHFTVAGNHAMGLALADKLREWPAFMKLAPGGDTPSDLGATPTQSDPEEPEER
jgi:hypothetical protein